MNRVVEMANRLGISEKSVSSFLTIQNMGEGVVQFEGFDVGFSLMRQEG